MWRDEIINYIINEYRKLAKKKYKTRQDWVGMVIYRESCKKFKFDRTNKLYIHNLDSIRENETYKLLSDFEIEMDHQISAKRADLEIVNKKAK